MAASSFSSLVVKIAVGEIVVKMDDDLVHLWIDLVVKIYVKVHAKIAEFTKFILAKLW